MTGYKVKGFGVQKSLSGVVWMKGCIILLYNFTTIGGTYTLLLRKARWYIRNGYRVILFLSYRNDLDTVFQQEGVEVVYRYLPVSKNVTARGFIDKYIDRMEIALREYGVKDDVLFIETASPRTAMIAERASFRWQVPTVTGIFHPRTFFDGSYGTLSWSNMLINYMARKSLYSMNEACRDSHQVELDLDFSSIPIFPPPLSSVVSTYRPRGNSYKVVSLGRLDPFKTYNIFMLDIIKGLSKEFSDLVYTIIGSGSQREQIVERIDQLGLNDRVKLVPYWPFERLGDLVKNYDINVGMGYSLLDIGAFGLPSLVATAYSDSILTPGYLFDLPNYEVGESLGIAPVSLAKMLNEFLHFPASHREKISEKTRAYIEEKYSDNSIMPRFIRFATSAQPADGISVIEPDNASWPPSMMDQFSVILRNQAYPLWKRGRVWLDSRK